MLSSIEWLFNVDIKTSFWQPLTNFPMIGYPALIVAFFLAPVFLWGDNMKDDTFTNIGNLAPLDSNYLMHNVYIINEHLAKKTQSVRRRCYNLRLHSFLQQLVPRTLFLAASYSL